MTHELGAVETQLKPRTAAQRLGRGLPQSQRRLQPLPRRAMPMMDDFNHSIVGPVEVVAQFRGEGAA